MSVHIKWVVISAMIFAAFNASAQTPPGAPSPARVDREVRSAQRDANDVRETVQAVNDAVNAMKDVRKMIDSIVDPARSKTPGVVHLIFVGINNNTEAVTTLENALKELKGISDLKKTNSTATVVFEMKSSSAPIDIWKDVPKSLKNSYFLHDKDAFNVVLLYRAPPPAKKN